MSYASDIENAFMGSEGRNCQPRRLELHCGAADRRVRLGSAVDATGKSQAEDLARVVGQSLVSLPSPLFGRDRQASYSAATAETNQPTLQEIKPLAEEYVVEWGAEQKKLVPERRQPPIWQEKARTAETCKGLVGDAAAPNSETPSLADTIRITLSSEANAVSGNSIEDLMELNIKWPNAFINSSSLWNSLRNGYIDKAMDDATSWMDGLESGFGLLALPRRKVRSTIRGGTFGENKSFEAGENVTVMPVR